MHSGRAHARVWAPACAAVDFVLEAVAGRTIHPLEKEPDGFFSATVEATAGDRYWFRLDDDRLRPDPRSRFQPDGPHGPSQIVDPSAFPWTDSAWQGIGAARQVIYEMHVGTYTPQGTWPAAAEQLPALASLGITIVEMMPLADFPGRFGWGYDGVNLYAPTRLYGQPNDLRAFIDRAHVLGLAVILDVVYNHLGPDGNYLGEFSSDYFTDKYTNDWGRALNFEGPRPVREHFVENAGYWIDEYHFDGLRLDATQDIHDGSDEHVLRSITTRARSAARGRSVLVIAENEPQDVGLMRTAASDGYGIDAMWNDDFHHSAQVALTGRREAYYTDYLGSPQELISSAKYGFLYQGQWYGWQKQRRGTPALNIAPSALVHYLQNHDQVANSAFGKRVHELTSPGRHRALTALLLLGRATPLIFQGQEFNASAPFLFFADLPESLREPVAEGRKEFLSQFPALNDSDVMSALAPPGDERTFAQCRLDLGERQTHAGAYALHRDLLRLRRTDPVIGAEGTSVDGAILAPEAFLLRLLGAGGDRLLLINLGHDLEPSPMPEPLLAPPAGCGWHLLWSSEAVAYGGAGTPPLNANERLHLPSESAVLLASERQSSEP
ncbi:MAG: malto-oligosyltrehalose trehalohydrolase [Acidobacteria bacterium]|nr:malto-oligosyltrehalose trehalohydrolase [Acidobacteriota bacterium]